MELNFKQNITAQYKSQAQVARVLTEDWVLSEIYCPNCGGSLAGYINNKPVADFYCLKCAEDFELKSKKGKIGSKVTAGAYSEMIKRIGSSQRPNFFFLARQESVSVTDLFVVPKYFFVPGIIEKRKPLRENAKRAGWVGSNILFSKIPFAGQIHYVKDGVEILKEEVLDKWNKTKFLKAVQRPESKGWILDIMNCIDELKKNEFSLSDLYEFEKALHEIHPNNKNVKPKIRQQLQFLRDKRYLEFVGEGRYRLV
ncbi:restriction endonuclease [Candidatus Nomurabacteria bacterium]|nr:restriction endonuclease [Candidatus Nomurabacteria bacterium]